MKLSESIPKTSFPSNQTIACSIEYLSIEYSHIHVKKRDKQDGFIESAKIIDRRPHKLLEDYTLKENKAHILVELQRKKIHVSL